MRLALYQPDIPQNAGAILRLAACFATPVDVIGPTGFDMSDRALRRAALDYLAHVEIVRHDDFQAFLASRAGSAGRLVLLSTHASDSVFDYPFAANDTILLGRESAGVPDLVRSAADARLAIPIQPGLRSLNVAMAAAIGLSEALRQTGGLPERASHG